MAVSGQMLSIDAQPLTQSSNMQHARSDEELIERSKQGDREAFSQLAGRYLNVSFAVALSITRNREDAEDACQDAMIKASRYIHTLRDSQKFGGWLRNIVKQEVYGKYRKQSRFWNFLEGFILQTKSDSAEMAFSNDQKLYQQQLFEHAIANLSTRAREVVLLHYMSELSCDQIASQIGISSGAVKSHLHKARNKMLKALAEIDVQSLDEI